MVAEEVTWGLLSALAEAVLGRVIVLQLSMLTCTGRMMSLISLVKDVEARLRTQAWLKALHGAFGPVGKIPAAVRSMDASPNRVSLLTRASAIASPNVMGALHADPVQVR